MDDSSDGLAWNRNRERRDRLWGKAEPAPPAPDPVTPPPGAAEPAAGVLSLGERIAAREARQLERAVRAGHRVILPTPRTPGPQQIEDDATLAEHDRPRTRGDCQDGPRPCPWVGCREHLYLQVSEDTGHIKAQAGEPWEMAETCALDVADRGGLTLEAVAEIMGVTRERVRQLEARGLKLMQRGARRLR